MSVVCAAVDWGTSSFRLWLLDAVGGVVAERRSDEGMLAAAPDGFARVLEAHLAAVGATADLPVIACGMVGSRQGWAEACYVETPATTASLIAGARRVPDHGRPVFLLPGVAQHVADRPDVMRGEETQLLGLPQQEAGRIVCLPGTHSKWVGLERDRIESFATFLTGDLFAAVARHTILRHSIQDPTGPLDRERFAIAFRSALERPSEVSNRLFALRAASLLGRAAGSDGASALSGLLVGLEFAGGLGRFAPVDELTLVASGRLLDIYQTACQAAGIAVTIEDAEAAVRRGLFAAAKEILS